MRSECDNGHTEKSWKKNMNILVAFSRTFARFSFATVNQNRIHQPARLKMWICLEKVMFLLRKSDFLECREKRLEFRLGSAFFGISEVDFLP